MVGPSQATVRSPRVPLTPDTRMAALTESPSSRGPLRQLADVLRRYWGYDTFRPLQQEAMAAVLSRRDSLVVLPTGGGKSLCFQAPAMCQNGVAIVVSPLISLMKDQVEGLTDGGVPAALVNSTLSLTERRAVADRVRAGAVRLLYVAPERLVQQRTIDFLRSVRVSFIAVDEAHCISQWGHDFRPEYRELSRVRDAFPDVPFHAFTATATQRVRDDIAIQLGLKDPEILVGSFDRPNLVYRVQRRTSALPQIREVLDRHPGESGIIYCISRARADQTSRKLNDLGYRTRPYHAGLDDEVRQVHQDAFIAEEIDTIVATVAFGMGIDKSNVRYVIHNGMPKSLEHYQQEAGRAGRDGLEAECVLLHSAADFVTWQRILEENEPASLEAGMASLQQIANYCGGLVCRHRTLVEHFGEAWERDSCEACDVCSGALELVDDPLLIARKILSSVVRQGSRFGGDYTAMVLKGSQDQRVLDNRHNELSTWGLLADESKKTIREWIEQLVVQNYMVKRGEYNVLELTSSGVELLRGEGSPRLLKPAPAKRKPGEGKNAADSWEGVDHDLFDRLRELRRGLAGDRGVPPYVVFNDATLREMARSRPATSEELNQVRGVGEKKLAQYGDLFLGCIAEHVGGSQPR